MAIKPEALREGVKMSSITICVPEDYALPSPYSYGAHVGGSVYWVLGTELDVKVEVRPDLDAEDEDLIDEIEDAFLLL